MCVKCTKMPGEVTEKKICNIRAVNMRTDMLDCQVISLCVSVCVCSCAPVHFTAPSMQIESKQQRVSVRDFGLSMPRAQNGDLPMLLVCPVPVPAQGSSCVGFGQAVPDEWQPAQRLA